MCVLINWHRNESPKSKKINKQNIKKEKNKKKIKKKKVEHINA